MTVDKNILDKKEIVPDISQLELAASAQQCADEVLESGLERNERGMTTAEYAVGTVAAVSFAGVLFGILRDPEVREALLRFVLWLLELFFTLTPFG